MLHRLPLVSVLLLVAPLLAGAAAVPEEDVDLDVRSRWLALPISVEVGGTPVTVYRVGITGTMAPEGDGRGVLRLHGRRPVFNDFGDASSAGPPASFDVILRRVEPPAPERRSRRKEDDGQRRVYDVHFDGAPCSPSLHLVVALDGVREHRLLVHPDRTVRRLAMTGTPAVVDPIPPAPLDVDALDLSGDRIADDRITGLRIFHADGGLQYQHDQNIRGFDRYGDGGSATLVYYFAKPALLEPLGGENPAGQGRRRFRVAYGEPTSGWPRAAPSESPAIVRERYELVLAPEDAGPHRLLVYREQLEEIVVLRGTQRSRQRAFELALRRLAPAEQDAYRSLRDGLHNKIRARIEERDGVACIIGLSLTDVGAMSRFEGALNSFPCLERLTLMNVRFDAPGLRRLAALEPLRSVHLHNVTFEAGDGGSRPAAVHLKWFSVRGGRGLTPGVMGVIGTFSDLVELNLTNCDVTDDGLVELCGLARLETLRIHALRPEFGAITDAGLAHLAGFEHLVTLNLMQQPVTEDGLVHLERLPRLQNLTLSCYGVSENAVEEFMARREHRDVPPEAPD